MLRLVAGGDGTVKWVIGLLESLKLTQCVPVGVIPFGTGNDTARTLGWGGYSPSNLVDRGLVGFIISSEASASEDPNSSTRGECKYGYVRGQVYGRRK